MKAMRSAGALLLTALAAACGREAVEETPDGLRQKGITRGYNIQPTKAWLESGDGSDDKTRWGKATEAAAKLIEEVSSMHHGTLVKQRGKSSLIHKHKLIDIQE